MGREARIGAGLVDPTKDRVVHLSDISKAQLARVVNEQAARIKELDVWMKTTGRLLLTIALEPDAFHVKDGLVHIDRSASEKVKPGMQLFVDMTETHAVLKAVVPEHRPLIELPNIIVPPGVS